MKKDLGKLDKFELAFLRILKEFRTFSISF